MASTQRNHWWFSARRSILEAQLKRLKLPVPARVLEVGCGTGGNLPMLERFGHVDAMEMDEYAIGVAREQSAAEVRRGWLPDAVPYDGTIRYDVICMFDVLEHCPDDRAALHAVLPLLAAGGRVFVTVPAYQWLFGAHDRAHHHHRHYTMASLRSVASEAGLAVDGGGYFNTLLFPIVAVRRLLARIGLGIDYADAGLPPKPLNDLLRTVFGVERWIVPWIKFPFGTSVIAVLRPAHRT